MSGFPERLKEVRSQLGLTQEQLAEELHVTKASISAWENGREAPRFNLLPLLRKVLGVSLDTLMCGEGVSVADQAREHAIRTRNEAEASLLKAFRRLPAKRKRALLDMLN